MAVKLRPVLMYSTAGNWHNGVPKLGQGVLLKKIQQIMKVKVDLLTRMDVDGGEKKEVRRPMNAFLIFCKRHRSVVRQKNPDMDNRSVTHLLGDLWANLGEEKSTYTNLAKQYKDAFMKAHPNYKWHSNEKSHVSSAKLPVKPTNALVMKSVADLSQEGGITPGKLADLDKMGGLNLLLMADKETSHEAKATSSLSTVSQSAPQQSTVKSEQSGASNNALLQLAEMCSSELHSSSDRQGTPLSSAHLPSSDPQQLPTSKVCNLDAPLSMLSSLNSSSHQPMPPPKKRARHWSLTETDNAAESPAGSLASENKLPHCQSKTDLSPLNLSIYSQRLLSLPQSEDRYSSVEKYKILSPRRRLSSSATESIPSPSPPYVDGAESPVFATEASDNQAFFNLPTFSASRDSSAIVTKATTAPLPPLPHRADLSNNNGGSHSQAQLQLVSVEASKTVLAKAETSESSQSVSHGSPHPSNPKLLADAQFKVDIKMEKHNPDFYQWREPSKTKSLAFECSPQIGKSQIEDAVPRNKSKPFSAVDESFSKINDGSPFQNLFTEEQQNYPRYESANEVRQAPFSSKLLLQNIKFEHELKPAIQGKLGLTSSICEDKKFALVNEPETSLPKLNLSSNNVTSSGCGLFQQFESLKKLTMNLGASVSPNLKDLYEPALRLPNTPTTANTFSEGKLKKKWAERMLVEAKLEEDITQRQNLAQEIERKSQASGDLQLSSLGKNGNLMSGQAQAPDAKFPFSNKSVKVETRNDQAGHSHNLKSGSNPNETQNAGSHHGRLILNQPLDAVKSYQSQNLSFSASSHPKLMLQLSQGQSPQQYRPGQIWHQRYWNDAKIKQALDTTNRPDEQKLLSFGLNSEVPNKTQPNNKPILKPIAACGKKIYDHIVQQLCKSDFSGDKISENTQSDQDTMIRPDDNKVEKLETQLQSDERKDCRPLTASSLVEKVVREVCGSPPGKDGCTSCRKVEPSNNCVPFIKSMQQSPCSNHTPLKQDDNAVSPQNFGAWQTYRQTPPSPTNEADSVNQWQTHPVEAGDRSDHEDTNVPPVRKSRRANRGQKYQELIKEGFIQPSRERLAARNAERNGRSFGTREEYDKMEGKRTLKRSASERDAPVIDTGAINANVPNAITKNGNEVVPSDDKRFRNGGFDLEREIESLPVCSIDQMEKKKSLRRRCDSETLSRTKSVYETEMELLNPSSHKSSPAVCSVNYQDSGCPAPHIPIPKENRPSEPLTGSRKRKARNYCITRISMQTESDDLKEQPIQETDKNKVDGGKSAVRSSDKDKNNHLSVESEAPCTDKDEPPILCKEEVSSKTLLCESKQPTIRKHDQVDTKPEVLTHHTESLNKSHCFGPNQLPILAASIAEATSVDTAVATSALLVLSSFNADPAIKNALSLNRNSPTSFSSLWNIGRATATRLVNQESKDLSCPSVANSPAVLNTAKFFNQTERNNSTDTQALMQSFKSSPATAKARKISKSDPMQNHLKLTSPEQNSLKALQILKNLDESVIKKDKTGSVKIKEPKSSPAVGKSRRINISRSKHKNESLQQDKKHMDLMRQEVDVSAGAPPHVPFSKTTLVTTLQCPSEVRCHKKFQTSSKCQDEVIKNNQLTSLKSSSLEGHNTSSITNLSKHLASSTAGVSKHAQDSGIKNSTSSSAETTSGEFCNKQPFKSELVTSLSTRIGLVQTLMSKSTTPGKSESALTDLKCSESNLQVPTINSALGTVKTLLQQCVTTADCTKAYPAAMTSCSQVILTAKQIFEQTSFSQMKQNSLPTQHLSKSSNDSVTLVSPRDNPSGHTSYEFVCHGTTCSIPTSSESCATSPPSSGNGYSTSSSLFSVTPASTVISKTTSASSNLNEIVSYSVIGSSTVMESGSPHMIGSPHLPESPSVAVVQS